MDKKNSSITKEQLIEFGMVETGDPVHPMEKLLSDKVEGSEFDPISLCVTHMRNIPELCLMLPDGACIYLAIGNIKDLKIFAKSIQSWEPNF